MKGKKPSAPLGLILKVQLALLGLAGGMGIRAMAADLHFDTLRAGAQIFSNVTVQSKSDRYVFIRHAGGLSTIKVQDLSPEVRAELGFPMETEPASKKSILQNVKHLPIPAQAQVTPQVQELEKQMRANFVLNGKLDYTLMGALFFFLLAFHLFFSYTGYLICTKAGHDPGILIWIPAFQGIPLLRAAGMSGWWFLGMFVPFLSLVVFIMWCVKICQARGKSLVWAIMLMLPGLGVIAYLYLAFSNGSAHSEGETESWRLAPHARL